jgi:hypothetical protein
MIIVSVAPWWDEEAMEERTERGYPKIIQAHMISVSFSAPGGASHCIDMNVHASGSQEVRGRLIDSEASYHHRSVQVRENAEVYAVFSGFATQLTRRRPGI